MDKAPNAGDARRTAPAVIAFHRDSLARLRRVGFLARRILWHRRPPLVVVSHRSPQPPSSGYTRNNHAGHGPLGRTQNHITGQNPTCRLA